MSTQPGSEPALDPSVIADLRRAQLEYGNPEFIAQLVALFQANAPARLALIREAVAARDSATLGHTAHTLKSNCGMLGARTLSGMCARLEAYGDAAAPEDAAALLDEADRELAHVLAELEELLAGLRGRSS
jgi:HPt (histidine-containing phosphotransfer) domain-containing protein